MTKEYNRKKMRSIVIVAGAGISMAPPSNLPSWWEYNKMLIEEIKSQTLTLCPDAVQIIDKIDVEHALPVQCISDVIVREGAGKEYFSLLELLDAALPNANHYAIAELAGEGILKAVITTNFDTLLEKAFRQKAIPLMQVVQEEIYYESADVQQCRLFKIHGSVTDKESLIDTVTQKAKGLSDTKKYILEEVMKESDLVFLGFSGADFDFNQDYIPIAQATEQGSNITWLVQPGKERNQNMLNLLKRYPDRFHVFEGTFADFFISIGIEYDRIQEQFPKEISKQPRKSLLKKKIHELFSSPGIGEHGCMGYCISFLNMIGERKAASELAQLYEEKMDLSAIDILTVPGLFALARQKLQEADFDKSIQYNLAALHCLMAMEELTNKAAKWNGLLGLDKTEKECMKENIRNKITVYINLGMAYFAKDEVEHAEKYLKLAENLSEQEGGINMSIIQFDLARLQYKQYQDDSRFLARLQTACGYASKEGNLTAQMEIMNELCKMRMERGDYFIAQQILDDGDRILKNVGDLNIHLMHDLLKVKLFLRRGNNVQASNCMKKMVNIISKKKQATWAEILLREIVMMFEYNKETGWLVEQLSSICGVDSSKIRETMQNQDQYRKAFKLHIPFFIINTLPEHGYRKEIILLEYFQDKQKLPALFKELCLEYVKNYDSKSLYDTSQCYLDAALTEEDKITALYYLGCSYMDNKAFGKAEKIFEDIVRMQGNAEWTRWAWSHIELAKIQTLYKGDIASGRKLYYKGKEVLRKHADAQEMVNGCMGYVAFLTEEGYPLEALSCASELLEEKLEPKLKKSISTTIGQIKWTNHSIEADLEVDTDRDIPQKIANTALQIYNNSAYKQQAWKLIYVAKEKYEGVGDLLGMAYCENNMGNFCWEEGKIEEAAAHFKLALDIKKKCGDWQGIVNELSNIIMLYLKNGNADTAEQYVNFAVQHIPEYNAVTETSKIFFALHLYYTMKKNLSESLKYAKLAQERIEYLKNDVEENTTKFILKRKQIRDSLQTNIAALESVFRSSESEPTSDEPFIKKLSKANRLYKLGKFDDSYILLENLKQDNKEDLLKQGQILGTYGNIYLHQKEYEKAIEKYQEAEEILKKVPDPDIEKAEDFIYSAIYQKTVALGYLGKEKEALAILQQELKKSDMKQEHKFSMTISFLNRTIALYETGIEKNSALFKELLELLNGLKEIKDLSHEMRGVLYSAFGNLFSLSGDKKTAVTYFIAAKKELMIINAPAIERIDLALEKLGMNGI